MIMNSFSAAALRAMGKAFARGEDIHEAALGALPNEGANGLILDVIEDLVREGCLPTKCVLRNGRGDVSVAYALELTPLGRTLAAQL